MGRDWDENVFAVDTASAKALTRVGLGDLAFTERAHLQEWIIDNPSILAPDAKIITFEFDQWRTANGAQPRDRLDVLALGGDGRLIVAELKRGVAPDPTEMQAIKYAAMASRFTDRQLAAKRKEFLTRRGEVGISEESVFDELNVHTSGQMTAESLRDPRIVLVAEDFSPTTTTSVVWLSERGINISLVTYRAYRTPGGETLLTTSRIWPVPQAEDFVAAPRSATDSVKEDLPEVPWTREDLSALTAKSGSFMLTVLDTLARHPGDPWNSVDFRQLDLTPHQSSGTLGAIATAARRQFGRANSPVTYTRIAGVWHWSMDPALAVLWRSVRGLETEASIDAATPVEAVTDTREP